MELNPHTNPEAIKPSKNQLHQIGVPIKDNDGEKYVSEKKNPVHIEVHIIQDNNSPTNFANPLNGNTVLPQFFTPFLNPWNIDP